MIANKPRPFIDLLPRWRQNIETEKIGKLVKTTKREVEYWHPTSPLPVNRYGGSIPVTGVNLGQDGSFRTYLAKAKQPVRFFPNAPDIKTTALYKRILVVLTKSISQMSWWKQIITGLAVYYNLSAASEWLDHIFNTEKCLPKEENYSQPAKEVRRCLRKYLDDKQLKGIFEAIILVFEMDSAYRYRGQDILMAIDKNNLKGFKIINETIRLCLLAAERGSPEENVKYTRIAKILKILMFISPKLRNGIREFLQNINIDEIKFSEEDLYWICDHRGGYNFMGKSLEERQKANIEKYGVVF